MSILGSVIRNHIVPSLGKIPLDLLTTAHVQELLNRLSDAGLSAETVATVRRILCIVINRAVDYKLIDHNPAKVSRAPRIESKLPTVLNKEEVNRLLDYASDSRFLSETNDEVSLYLRYSYYVAVQLSVDTGIRQGELRSMQWGDLKDGRLYVNRAMEGSKIGTPKTKSGYRGITLSKTTLAVLRDWRVYQEAYCQKWQFWQVSEKSLIVSNGFGNWYGGLAYEYEFDGEAKGTVNGKEIRAASIRGSSVRGEFGMKMSASKDNPWQADISIYGYGGKHRGFGGNVSVAYTF